MAHKRYKIKDFYKLTGIDDVLKSLGLSPEEGCIKKNVDEVKKSFFDEVGKSVVQIVSSVGKDLIRGIINMSSNVVTSAGSVAYTNFVGELIMGNLVGGFLGILCASLAFLPFLEIYIYYLAVKYLRDLLYKRIYLLKILSDEIEIMIQLLKSVKNLMYKDENLSGKINFDLILKNLKSAELLINNELNRYTEENLNNFKYNTKRVIQVENIRSASKYIEKAIDLITNNLYSYFNNKVNEVQKKYNIKSKMPDSPNPIAWVKYLNSVSEELEKSGRPENIKREIFYLIISYFPITFKFIIFKNLFFTSAEIINNFTPIYLEEVFDKNLDYILKKENVEKYFNFYGNIQKLLKYFNLPFSDYKEKEKRIKNIIKDFTLDTLNTSIKYYEILISSFPEIYQHVYKIGVLYIQFLENASSLVKEVREDIKNHSTMTMGTIDLNIKKIEWVSKLSTAKMNLSSITSNLSGYKISSSSTNYLTVPEMLDFVDQVGEKIERLKDFIANKYVNKTTGETFTEPSEIFVQDAQSLFSVTFNEISLFYNLSKVDEIISKLQSLKFLLTKQKSIDEMEFRYAAEVVSTAESHPAFPFLTEKFNKILKDAGSSINELKQALREGDVLKLANAVNATDSTSNIINMFSCPGIEESSFTSLMSKFVKPDLDLPDISRLKKVKEEVIDETLQNIKQKESLINKLINGVNKIFKMDIGAISSDSINNVASSVIKNNFG